MHTSYKRYWEPSTGQAVFSSVTVGLIATALTQPLDIVKTRTQQRAEGIGVRQISHYAGYNPHKVFREIHAQGKGLTGFYAGLDSALLGRGVYLFSRNLVYKIIYDRFKPRKPTNDLTAKEKNIIAGIAGGIGAVLSNPFEVILTRQQTDGALNDNRRRGYTNVVDGYNKISMTEKGYAGLMKGVVPNVLKAVALNVSFSIPYNYMNECMWTCFGDMGANRPVALFFGAFFASAFTLPFDNIRFRFQYAFNDPHLNRVNYEGVFDCIKKVWEIESWQGFYSGFYSFYAKTLVYGACTIMLMDWLTTRWKKNAGLKPEQI